MFMMAVLVTVFYCTRTAPASSEILTLNCSERYWYPFLYTQEGQARGILYDIVNKAVKNLKIKAHVEPVPFRRAVAYARKGKTDGIIGVGFHSHLRQILDYPPGAEKDTESPWRIMQVDHVVVCFAEKHYELADGLKSLPAPVRILQNSPVVDHLEKLGIKTQEVREDLQNFQKLVRDKKGVVITTSVVAEMMNRDPRYKGKIKIHETPVASHAYYLAFSKKSRLAPEDKERLWREIVRWRDDYVFMLQMFSRY